MEILSVTLKNFKSHSDRHFQFQPGTNAICGENGAGKTSILEAIAWALFNHRGGYKTEDLIRNGAASAQVSVAFISNRDQRTYEVNRCTRAGYTLYDPQLGAKLDHTRIEEEVLPWLRQQLGVAPGTDLADLFANTIGVPQGMFTADFLKPDRERKKTFDTILKVDEYRRVHDELLPLSKYAEAVVKTLEAEIARYDDDLQALKPLLQQHREQQAEIEQAQADQARSQAQLVQLQTEQAALSAQATQILDLETQAAQLTTQIQAQTKLIDRLRQDWQQADAAATLCTTHRESYQTVLQADKTLQELEQQRRAEQTLQKQRQQQWEQSRDRQTQLATLAHQQAQLAKAEAEILQLEPLVAQQLELEQAQQAVTQQLQTCTSWRQSMTAQSQRLVQLQTRLAQVTKDIARIRALTPLVEQIPTLEQQQERCQQHLSRIAAAAQFEADLRQLWTQATEQRDRHLPQVQQVTTSLRELQQAVPLWAEALELALTTLQDGTDGQQQLMTALEGILSDLTEQTDGAKLEQQLKTVQKELKTVRQHQATLLTLDHLLTDQRNLEAEATDLQASLAALQTNLATEPALQQQQQQLTEALQALDDPRGRCRLRQQELQQQAALTTQIETIQTTIATMQQAIAALDTQLATYANLSDQIQTQQALREQHREAHQTYLEHQKLANSRRDRQTQLETAIAQLEPLEQNLKQLTEARDRLSATFDPEHFQAIQTAHQQANAQLIALTARLPDMLKYLESLDQQLTKLATIQTKRQQAESDLKQKRKIQHFVKFARDTYKKAGPRITERYIQSISREADKLFRELLNRPNVALEWTRDYDIVVQEGANNRRFINLSGGEQMCAALAVRLALLKILADIDIAFFDEPTTNMDKPRRAHLAEAIANIKSFRQLFVISHDDTFETITENVIVVERETS